VESAITQPFSLSAAAAGNFTGKTVNESFGDVYLSVCRSFTALIVYAFGATILLFPPQLQVLAS
jgi:hypothetical protein